MGATTRLVPALERATYRAEAPVRKVVRSHRLNPLPHAGTISVFLLIVVVATGVYITLFFGFGFEASHRSVERMADHPIQSLMRTLHRYSSALLVVTTLVHAWRIFVGGRFRGPRRWRWTSGVAALVTVWLAGVTGYWLVWDERAAALNEATRSLLGWLSSVETFFVRDVYGPGAGSGWGVLFVIWIVHLLLTVVIGYAIWRHVRATQLRVMPPRHWMIAAGAALVLASLLIPADLLERADAGTVVGGLPIDPFVLFLLPPLLSDWAWLAVLVMVGLVAFACAAPHLLAAPTPVVDVDPDACTGCELCVIDCPYLALRMEDVVPVDAADGVQHRRPIAVLDADRCVGCGICIGSCSFAAIELDGHESPDVVDPAGKHVVVACARHAATAGDRIPATDATGAPVTVVEVACTGMLHANVVGSLLGRGAAEVQVVGCPPDDCAYGTGNTILDERLAAGRSPHPPRAFVGAASEDWVAPGELLSAIAHPDAHRAADGRRLVGGRRAIGAFAVVVVSVLAVAAATLAPYGGSDASGVRVIVDHRPGAQLEGQPAASGQGAPAVDVVVGADGAEVGRVTVDVAGGEAIGIVDIDTPERGEIEVTLVEGGAELPLFAGPAAGPSRRVVVPAVDVPPSPGAEAGREVFEARNLGACGVCHSVEPGDDGVGPSLAGIGTTAADRVPGLDAREYLRQSILEPDAHVVEGYRAGQMLPIYEDRLSQPQIDALVEYLLSLTGGGP